MTAHNRETSRRTVEPVWLSVSRKSVAVLAGGIGLGILLVAAGMALYADGWRRLQLGYLVAFAFVLSLSLGSMFFVLLQHLTRAGWSVVVRRPAEIFSLNIVAVAVLALPIVWWVQQGELYPWAGDTTHAPATGTHAAPASTSGHDAHSILQALYAHQSVDELTLSKAGWLNATSFLVRIAIYFLVWTSLAGFWFFRSRRQDLGDPQATQTRKMEWHAGITAIAFGLTLTFAAFDFLMSLDPHWYSTMFGVYFFAGCAVGGFSLNLLTVLLAARTGLFPDVLSTEHRRDLGRFLFAFVFFWGYIAFSQYMLLWYANVPETTRWFAIRGASMAEGYGNSWGWLLTGLLFGHFVIPFLGIMSRHVKAHPRAMIFWTIWLLAMHYLDLYWLVMPELGPHLTMGPIEVGALSAVGCFWLLGASWFATRTSLVPVGDPRLIDSLRASEVY